MSINKISTGTQVYATAAKVQKANETAQRAQNANREETPELKQNSAALVQDANDNAMEEISENTKNVKNAIAEVNKKMNQKTRCEFAYHEDTKRISIKVIDSSTDKLIREIPPEETLDMISKMWEVAGILFDEQR